MANASSTLGKREMEPLIVRAIVRKLLARGILSEQDVRDMLVEAAEGIDLVGGTLTRQAARAIAEEDLIPAFIGKAVPPDEAD